MRIADLIACVVILVIAVSLWRAHRDPKFEGFNVFDLIMDNGKLDPARCLAMGAFAMASWQMWRMTIDGKMTDGFFTAYLGAFVAPAIAKMFAPAKPG